MTYIANLLVSKEEKEELLDAFQALDEDGNGILTKDELVKGMRWSYSGYKKIYPQSTEKDIEFMVDEVVKKIDVNHSGQVDFTEFVVASINQSLLLKKEKIAQAFEMIDLDGDGQIDKKELKLAMGGINLDEDDCENIIREYDLDNNGKVNSL